VRRIWAQAAKEWAGFRRDRLSLSLAFLLPLATLLLFGYGVRLSPKNIPVVVQDLDNSPLSRALVERLLNANVFAPGARDGRTDPIDAIESGGARAAVLIPPAFGREIEMGRQAEFQSLIDGSDINSAEVVRAVVRGATASFLSSADNAEPAGSRVHPLVSIWFNPGGKESLFIVPGVFGIILWMYPALLAAVAVAREVEQGTDVQIYASGLSAVEVLLGKGLVYFAVGIAEALVVMAASCCLFGLTVAGDPAPLAVSTLIYVAGAVAFGLLAGVLSRAETIAVQATASGGFFPALLLSGFVYPIDNIPFPLSLACLAVPARYYIQVCRDTLLRGAGWRELWYEPVVLALFSAALFTGAWCGMRRMQVRS